MAIRFRLRWLLLRLSRRGNAGILTPDQFDVAYVPESVVRDHERGHQEERIRDYLLNLFLRQLEQSERDELILCAIPRTLDVAVLRATLQLPTDIEARRRWDRYARLSFTAVIEHDRLVLHPLVRTMLLRHIPPDVQSGSDYVQIHQRLRAYFHKLASTKISSLESKSIRDVAQIEEIYHTLALGNLRSAVEFGVNVQRNNIRLWEPFLEAVRQAPFISSDKDLIAQGLRLALHRVDYASLEEAVTVIVLFTWSFTSFQNHSEELDRIMIWLGNAYSNLPGVDGQKNQEKAIGYYEAALEIDSKDKDPETWASIQINLGVAYQALFKGDIKNNREKAIGCYEAALEIYNKDKDPKAWAKIQNNLGVIFSNIDDMVWENRQRNLERAIRHLNAALEVYTQVSFPKDWAITQTNLGGIFFELSNHNDKQQYLEQAIHHFVSALEVCEKESYQYLKAGILRNLGACYAQLPLDNEQSQLEESINYYHAALEIHTKKDFPIEWAKIKMNLAPIYRELKKGGIEENLEQCIRYYRSALEVFTKEAFPVEWAKIQNDMGTLFSMVEEDGQNNQNRSIKYFNKALEVYIKEYFPREWGYVQSCIGLAYSKMSKGNQENNFRRASQHYKAALEVFDREDFPSMWAMVHRELGFIYGMLGELLIDSQKLTDGHQYLALSIECFKASLEIYNQEDFPEEWKNIQDGLSAVYLIFDGN